MVRMTSACACVSDRPKPLLGKAFSLQVVDLYKDITAAFEELANEPEAPKPETPLEPEQTG